MADLTTNTTSLQRVLDAVNNLLTISDITPEVIGAATDDHTHTASEVGAAASSHTQAASTITAGTFAGAVVAQTSSQAPSTSLLRNSKIVSTATNPSNNGEIVWVYD